MLLTPQARASDCREESLVHFFSQGAEVSSEVIGAADPCDEFGGNLVYTPKHHLFLYVNFNIPGNIDLDEYEQAFVNGGSNKFFYNFQVAIVDKGFIKRMYNSPKDAVLSIGGDTLFISEVVVAEGRLTELMNDFFSSGP